MIMKSMDTINNQLIKIGAKEGDLVLIQSWTGRVYMNEFGLGLEMMSSHEPSALCDGCFPAMAGLRLWNKSNKKEEK